MELNCFKLEPYSANFGLDIVYICYFHSFDNILLIVFGGPVWKSYSENPRLKREIYTIRIVGIYDVGFI